MIGEPYLLLNERASRSNLNLNKNKFVKDLLKIVDKDKPKSDTTKSVSNNFKLGLSSFWIYNPSEGRQRDSGLRYSEMERPSRAIKPNILGIISSQTDDGFVQLLNTWVDEYDLNELSELQIKMLSGAQNKYIVSRLENRLDIVDWFFFSKNNCAVHILEKNLDKVYWNRLSLNENAIHLLIRLDTNKMKQNMKSFAEELVAHVFHPVRLNRIATRLGMDLDDLLDTF